MFDFETDRFNGVIVKLNELGNVEREKFSENLKTVNLFFIHLSATLAGGLYEDQRP